MEQAELLRASLQEGGDPTATVQQMLNNNPRAQAIFELLNAQNQPSDQEEQQKLIRQNKQLLKALKKSQAEIRRLSEELQVLEGSFQFFLEINDNLAAATGSCPECWGAIDNCEQCQGNGEPGAFIPDMEAFNYYIRPVLKHVKKKARPAQPKGNHANN